MKINVLINYKNGDRETFLNANGLIVEGHKIDVCFPKQITRKGIPHKVAQVDIEMSAIRNIEIFNEQN
ncbi:MAG: hypothetical protein LBV17_10185 [Treponema sp.]|jgi:hypothetical protein|nr:hypothetical protein [Treponema sp.]